jgi:peptide/nickel transport system substrate-binding protein
MQNKKNKGFVFHLLILIVLLVVAVSCKDSNNLRDKKLTVFRYNESKGIPTLDPAYAKNQTVIWPVNQLFNGLVQLNNRLNVKPCIASHWKISDDGTCLIFYLRKDVFFHDCNLFPGGKGRRVISADFSYSFGRITDPDVASPGAWIFNNLDKSEATHFTGFETPDDTTFVIHLINPFPAFTGMLSMQYCSVVPREVVEYYGKDFRNHPVGTGPFMFKTWKEGEKLVLVKNLHYFEKDSDGNSLPYIDAVAISFVADKQSEFLEFVKGNLDFLSGLHPGYKDELITRSGRLNPKYSEKFVLIKQPYLNTEYLGFLMDDNNPAVRNSPLYSGNIRKAINYGFDRIKMMTYLRNNIGRPATSGFIPRGIPSFSEEAVKGYYYDPDKARDLLASAGYPGGSGLPLITLTTTNDYLDLCEFIQHQLSQIGIRLRIEICTGASFLEMVAGSKLLFFRGSWIADYPDAENYLSLFYTINFSPAGPNYFHYSNKAFDELYIKAMKTSDDSLRFNIYQRMDSLIISDAVLVPLYYDDVVRFTRKNITGLGSNPMNLLTLKRVKVN